MSLDINCSYRLPQLQFKWESKAQYCSDKLVFGSQPARAHSLILPHLRIDEFITRVAYNAGETIERTSAFQILILSPINNYSELKIK